MRRHKDTGSQGVNLAIIITPMLDMAFQILSFFIMTYHPSALEGHIPGSLVPPDKIAQNNKKQPMTQPSEPLPSVPEEELAKELADAPQIMVKAVPKGQVEKNRREGQPSEYLIKEGSTDANWQTVANIDNEIDQSVALLQKRLTDLAKSGGDKSNIKIAADGALREMYVMQVYDAAKKAGYGKVHFVPPPAKRAQ